jgi:hypothetical protein
MWEQSPERRAAYRKSGARGGYEQASVRSSGKNLAALAVDDDNYLRKYRLL